MARKMLIILLAAAFSLSLSSVGITGDTGKEGKGTGTTMGEEVKGTVTKLVGNIVAFRDAECNEQTVMTNTPEELADIRVGDRVLIKDGRLTKADYSESSAPFPGERC